MSDQSLLRAHYVNYDVASPMRNLAFWRGALTARQQVMVQASDDYEKGIHAAAISRIEAIMEALSAGAELESIPEYVRWLAQ